MFCKGNVLWLPTTRVWVGLTGIAPAPRGIPQIEVKFDIDANGIVNVSAKDLGTGQSQSITITSSGGLSDDEIQRMMQDADKYKEEDEKRKKEVEVRNQADAMIYQVDKTLKDFEDKVQPEEKDSILAAKGDLETAISGGDIADIEAKMEVLTQALYKVSERVYGEAAQAQQAADAAGAAGAGTADDNVVDAEIVDDDK